MGKMTNEIIKKYDEPIKVKSRETVKFILQSYQLEIEMENSKSICITKEKLLNEIYSDSSYLNNYINSITHSLVCYEGSSRRGEEIIYFTDTKGKSKELNLTGIYQMLKQKASIVVTPEGIILLYRPDEIVATIDCYTEKFISVKNINCKSIENIFVDYETKKTYIDCVLDDGKLVRKEILFSFDFTPQKAPSSVVDLHFI